jgi:NADH-quinone oxidoreductase subunit C
MIGQHNGLKNDLLAVGVDVAETDHNQRGYHLEVMMTVDQVRKVAKKLYELEFFLVFVAGLHVQPEEKENINTSGLHLIYQFARYDRPCRINATVALPEDKTVPSICDIFHGANWHERETRDFFGVTFHGHPDLKPLLLRDEDTNFHPLLKEEGMVKTLEAVSWQPEPPDRQDGEPQKKSMDQRQKRDKKTIAADHAKEGKDVGPSDSEEHE